MIPTWLLGTLFAIAVLVLGACSNDGLDRADAVARVVADGGGRIDEQQATCFVDRVLDELGSGPLQPDAPRTAEQEARLTSIRVDCIGIATVGSGPDLDAGGVAPEASLPGPQVKGDSPELDALWDRCAEGYGQACDELFAEAVLGSEYESFAASCGGRTRELRCAGTYPEPGVVLPSPAQPSTTVPPPPP
jgi:hypothetical protein